MSRPDFITNEDIARWSKNLEEDESLSKELINSPIIREVCYAGLWLSEELEKLNCPNSIIVRIQYSAGKVSFSRDPWQVHQGFLEKYKNNELIFENDDENYKLN